MAGLTFLSVVSFVFGMYSQVPSVPVRTLDKGVMSQIDEPRQAVARTVDEFAALWTQHAGDRARPPVDFTREIVVGVFLGTRPTAGFSVEIVGAREEGGALVVLYREARPRPDMITAQVLTSPYQIVAVPKDGAVKFERVNEGR